MRVAVLATLLLMPCVAFAESRRVAVLELSNPAGLDGQEVSYLAGLVRGEALRLPSGRFLVVTRENLLELLPPGRTLENCLGDCDVETGRNIGADYVLSGEVVRFGGELRLVLRLHETREGRLLADTTARAPTVLGLEGPVMEAAREALGALAVRRRDLRPVPETREPAPLSDAQLSFAEVDVEALEAYDRAVRLDRGRGPAGGKAAAWREVAARAPRWRAFAESRAAAWEAHGEQVRAAREARLRRAELRDRDWRRLSRLLRLEVVSPAEKRRWAEAFLQTYGYDSGENPYVNELVRHAYDRETRLPATTPVERELERSVGRVVRLVTPDQDFTGLLRGYNGLRALIDVEGRLVDVLAEDIRRVAVFRY
jgi:TolB-like protein